KVSASATSSRMVKVASTSDSLRMRRMSPALQLPNFGSVYVLPSCSKVNTSSVDSFLRSCVFLAVISASSRGRRECAERLDAGAGPRTPPPRVSRGRNQRAVELLHTGRLAVVSEDATVWVSRDGHLVANRLTRGIHLVTDLGHLTRRDVDPNEIGAVDDIDDEALAAAGARRHDRHRSVDRVHIGPVVETHRLSLGLHHPEREADRCLGNDLAQHVSVLPRPQLLSRPLAGLRDPILADIAEIVEPDRRGVRISRRGGGGRPD